MQQIDYATMEDIAEIKALMDGAIEALAQKEWYVVDDEAFIHRHIVGEGYTLKYIIDERIAAFLIVRHPDEAEDNLGCYLKGHLPDESSGSFLHLTAHMESAAVHPDYRGRGVQGKLLQAAEKIECTRGTKYLMATVHPDNTYSLRNLRSAGYECLLETEKYGGLRRKVLCKKI